MIGTTYFCAVCQRPFWGRTGNGGRIVCGECVPRFVGRKITRQSAAAVRREIAIVEAELRERGSR